MPVLSAYSLRLPLTPAGSPPFALFMMPLPWPWLLLLPLPCFPQRLFSCPPVLFWYGWGPAVHAGVLSADLFPFSLVDFFNHVSLPFVLGPNFPSVVCTNT